MKDNKILQLIAAAGVALSFAGFSHAAVSPDIIASPVSEIACALTKAFIHIVGALAAVVFAVAGVRWIASRDDPGKRKAAKDTMVHALIGLAIVAIANSLVGALGTFKTCK